jgi:hypothetical protein
MGTESDAVRSTRQHVYETLTAALQRLRGGAHPATMAQDLLRYAAGSRELVGLVEDGDRAVFYTANTRLLVAVAFDEHGVEAGTARQEWSPVSDPTAWVHADQVDLVWQHPRYDWVP